MFKLICKLRDIAWFGFCQSNKIYSEEYLKDTFKYIISAIFIPVYLFVFAIFSWFIANYLGYSVKLKINNPLIKIILGFGIMYFFYLLSKILLLDKLEKVPINNRNDFGVIKNTLIIALFYISQLVIFFLIFYLFILKRNFINLLETIKDW